MPSKDHKEQVHQDHSSADSAVDATARELLSIAKALEGTAERMAADDGKPDVLLMERAVGLILHAARADLIDSLVKLREVVPEASELLDEQRPTPAPERREPHADVILESVDIHDIDKRADLAGVRIEEMLQQIAVDGDPGEAAATSRRRLLVQVLARLWSYLSDTYPQQLSPKVAAIKHELLPGVDPWLGGERDFRKAAWVCTIIAKEIEERCDLSVAEASQITGVRGVTIARAFKYIKNNGKGGREARVNRQSLMRWKTDQYDVGVKNRKEDRKAVARQRKDKICSNQTCKEIFKSTTLKFCTDCHSPLVDKT